MIFKDADAAGLEPDARLTAMWLWTLGGMATNGNGKKEADGDAEKVVASTGYTLEFDAARKIAQGLGIHLEKSESIVEVKGGKARLLSVSERTRHLFALPTGRQGKDEATTTSARGRKKKKEKQRSLFEELDELEAEAETVTSGELKPQAGETVLDRVHQSMILFASGRGEASVASSSTTACLPDRQELAPTRVSGSWPNLCRLCIPKKPTRNVGWMACWQGKRD